MCLSLSLRGGVSKQITCGNIFEVRLQADHSECYSENYEIRSTFAKVIVKIKRHVFMGISVYV